MQIIFDSKEKSIVRLDKGESPFDVLSNLVKQKNTSCNFSMIGAASMVDLGYYNIEEKRYFTRESSSGHIEINSVSGSVGWGIDEPIVHMHGVFSNERNECFGGHIMKMVISATGELVISWLPEKLTKKLDSETNLKLFSK